MEQHFNHIGLSLITPSLTNPRKYFNPDRLQELANSIKASGVHSPVLLRYLPGSRAPDTDREVIYELVAGERRFRASVMAGMDTIPAIVRPLTDDQVLEIQIVENLQRDDLTELEEAEGYERLMEHSDISADAIGAKIGKSRSYVYARLTLLKLCQKAREAMRSGQLDASKGLLIARIPDEKLQLKALKEFTDITHLGEQRMSYRGAQEWIKQNVMLRLADARFKITDASLVEAAGSCPECPKRTGANPDLFTDIDSPDICTDPACFHGKQEAHTLALTETARKKGIDVIEGKEALEVRPHKYGTYLHGYTDIDDDAVDAPDGSANVIPLRDILNKDEKSKVKLFIDPHDGSAKHVIADSVAAAAVARHDAKFNPQDEKATGTKGIPHLHEETDEEKEHRLTVEYEKAWRDQVAQAVLPQINAGRVHQFEPVLLREMLLSLVIEVSYEHELAGACALGLDPNSSDSDDFEERIQEIPDTELGARICSFLLLKESLTITTWADGNKVVTKTPVLESLASSVGVDVAQIKGEVQEQMIASLNVPAAQPAKAAGKSQKKSTAQRASKLSPEDAMSGIAAAMQEDERSTSADAVASTEDLQDDEVEA